MVRLAFIGTLLLIALTHGGFARADRIADAEALFRAAKELTRANDWVEACPKFEASYELDPQLGVLMNIADCYEQLGKIATAWARWNAAEEWAKREQDDRVGFIQERRGKLIPRLPRMVIVVENPVDELQIQRGDVPVPPATYGLAVPVDPGPIAVTVRREESVLETREAEAVEGKVVELRIDLGSIAEAHPPRPGADRAISGPYDATHRNIGIVVAAVGAAATVIAGALEIGALVKKGEADAPDACVNRFCAPEGLADAQSAATLAEAGQWVGIVGLTTLAVGITVLLTAPDAPAEVALSPWATPERAGLSIGGVF